MTPAASDTIGEQIADALHYLSEHARSPLEGFVMLNAYLLCKGVAEQGLESATLSNACEPLTLPRRNCSDPMPALQYLEAEARRNNLQVAECILMATLSLWMIASDVEMVRTRPERQLRAM